MNENFNNQNFNNNVGQPMMNQPTGGMVNNNQKSGNDFVGELLKDKPRLIGLIGALVILIASFLPFIVAETSILGQKISESTSYWATEDGKIVFFAMIATLALIFFKKYVYAIIPLAISLFVFIIDLFDVIDTSGSYSYIEVKWGLGIYVHIIGFVAVCAAIFLYWKDNKDCFKETINKIKGKFNNQPASQPAMYNQQPVQPAQPMNQPVQPMNQPQPMSQPQPMMNEQPVQPMNDQNVQMNNNQNNNF